MKLAAEIEVADRGVAARLDVASGATLALIGPNGSGKSTLLAALAGLLRPDAGRVQLGSRHLFGASQDVAAHRRRVALLSQQPSLFEHLSVLDNVAFGPRCTGLRRGPARVVAREWLARLGADPLVDRRPAELSGGQAQRVALARALAAGPDLLLLDEPLSALDVEAAAELRHLLRDLLVGRTTVLVTHNVLDVLLLADTVAVLGDGAVVESGSATEVGQRPTSAFAARMFGWNLLSGVASGAAEVTWSGRRLQGEASEALVPGERALARFRPTEAVLQREPPMASPEQAIPTVVRALQPQGHLVRVRCDDLAVDVVPEVLAELGFGPGERVWVTIPQAALELQAREAASPV